MNLDKKTPIIIIGFGSIGKRHYRNLSELGYNNLAVFDPSDDVFAGRKGIKRIMSLNNKALKGFAVAFICSPNNLHIRHALICAQAGCQLFIEKPLSHNLNGLNELMSVCRRKKVITMVGCNMRFQPCLAFMKRYLARKKLGKIYSIAHEFGYFLPYWRPGKDYRKNYAANRSTGGGIILDDIHEFDLLFWLNNFQPVARASFIYDKASDLKIETEDGCLAAFMFKNKVLGLVKCDYLQQFYARNCKIVGAKGNLKWDFNKNIVWLETKGKSEKIFEVKNFDFNQVYIDEVIYFFKCLEAKKSTFNDIKVAASILKYCVNKR